MVWPFTELGGGTARLRRKLESLYRISGGRGTSERSMRGNKYKPLELIRQVCAGINIERLICGWSLKIESG